MHFAQILSFPFRLDSNKNNVNKSYNNNNNKKGNRNCFVGNALFGVVVAGAKLAQRCSVAACAAAAAVFILQMPIGSGSSSSSSPNQSDAPSMSVRQFVCPAEQKCRLAGQQQQLGEGKAVVDSASALHEGERGLQVGGIGNWDWAAAAGRAQLVAGSFELQKEPFFWFCLQHIQFFLFTAWIAILLWLFFCSLISVDKFCGNQRHKRKNNLAKLQLN